MGTTSDAMGADARTLVIPPGEGKTYGRAGAWTLVTKAGNAATLGQYALQEMIVAPGFAGVLPHIHHNEDEAIYVLEGEITLRIGERTITATPGMFVLMPRDVVHSFANPSSTATNVLVISSPGAVEEYFEAMAALAQASPTGQPDMAEVLAVAQRHNIEFVPPAASQAR